MGYLVIKDMDLSALTGLSTKLPGAAKKVEHIVAVQIARDTERYVPARTKSLVNRTSVDENLLIYPGPYASSLNRGKVMVDSETGRGPAPIPGVGPRYRKGALLKPSDRDMKISTAVHPNAQKEWFKASKEKNLEKWKRVTAKAVAYELEK